MRYKLPEALGGGEHEAAADPENHPMVGFDLGLASRLWLSRRDLTEAKDPLPDAESYERALLEDRFTYWSEP
jgi:hypothetical protein